MTTWMISDGDHVHADLDAAGGSPIRYLHGEAVDQLLARTDATGDTAWYLTDRLGSVRKVANAAGEVTGSLDHDPFGKPLARTGDVDRFGFTGREYEPATGLQHNRNREYDPALGRWTSRDPIGLAGGDANLYRYVGNEPTRLVDPFGLRPPAADSPGAPAPTLPPAPTRPPSMTPIGVDDGSPAEVEGRRAGEWLARRIPNLARFENEYEPREFSRYHELIAAYLARRPEDGQFLLGMLKGAGIDVVLDEDGSSWFGYGSYQLEHGTKGATTLRVNGWRLGFGGYSRLSHAEQAEVLERAIRYVIGDAEPTAFARGLGMGGARFARALGSMIQDDAITLALEDSLRVTEGTARLLANGGVNEAAAEVRRAGLEAAAGAAGAHALTKAVARLKKLRKQSGAVEDAVDAVEEIAPTNPAARRSFWNDPIDVNGRRVYQRNDLFDPQAVDANGLTNLQRMQKGRPPVGFDGEPVNLHHTIQQEPGPIAEVGGRFHSENTKTLHGLVEEKGSFRYSPDGKTTEAEKAFRRWSYRYWQDRAKGIE